MSTPVKVAINGFGRIGRTLMRQLLSQQHCEFYQVVAINDTARLDNLLYLFEFDSVHGRFPTPPSSLVNNGVLFRGFGLPYTTRFFSEREPENLPWKKLGVDIVVDGIFPTYPLLANHLTAGAKRVVLTAPATDTDVYTFTPGVNERGLTKDHQITSNASCTTNAAAPIIKSVLLSLGIKRLQIGTVHAYTGTQALVDAPVGKKDLRGSRAAAESIIPSSTGASKAIPVLFPELAGKVDGYSIRVPVPDGSLLLITAQIEEKVSVEKVNSLLTSAAKDDEWRWRKIWDVTTQPLVSRDIIGIEHGSLVDLGMTSVIDGQMVTIGSWYDNEWGYCCMLMHHINKVARVAGFIK